MTAAALLFATKVSLPFITNSTKHYKILVRDPEGERPRRRPSRTWEDNIEIYLKEIGLEG